MMIGRVFAVEVQFLWIVENILPGLLPFWFVADNPIVIIALP